uniref:Uncharacterized protein n=1 Tax=Alexandrium andersonii TaxID=327968 RepID=A0A7S2AGA3_9DINO|mmetsp:Transcript_11461/g.26077  ORF Transcript_11461/g.26077 Transcript_11461/m.26077 type:complete len:296 (+) Transcript_11461:67-954(+)
MSWYVGQDGRKLWVEREELVYTVGEIEGELPLEVLTYLSTNSQKPVFAEHIIEDDVGGSKKGKKAKDKLPGRQRGFVVRMDQDERSRILQAFRPAAEKLIASGAVSRIDVDDGASTSRKKKDRKDEDEQPSLLQTLGPNECRVETTARCRHNAHGDGFRIEVAEGGVQQRLHAFTPGGQLPPETWHARLVEAVEKSGSRVMLGRMVGEEGPGDGRGGRSGKAGAPDGQRDAEDAWLESLMGRCMISAGERPRGSEAVVEPAAPTTAEGEAEAAEGTPAPAPKKAPGPLPPWLRRR